MGRKKTIIHVYSPTYHKLYCSFRLGLYYLITILGTDRFSPDCLQVYVIITTRKMALLS